MKRNMFGVGAVDLPEIESRNSPGIGNRGNDETEIRDATEPLEVLKLELEALKLVPALVGSRRNAPIESKRDVSADQSWERVQSVRDALAAEIEVRKRQKRGSWTPRKVTPPPIRMQESRKRVESTRGGPLPSSDQSINRTNSGRGTEDYPIPVTRSLEQTTKAERKSQAIMERRTAVPKYHTAKKPPLAPRPRSLSPALMSILPPSPPPPPPTPTLRAKKSMLQIASPNPKSNKQALRIPDASSAQVRGVVQQKTMIQKPIQPIIIDAVEPVPGEYNVPIFVDDSEFDDNDVDVVEAGPDFHGSRDPLRTIGIANQQAPPYQIGCLIKSAYSLVERESDPAWPEELEVATKQNISAQEGNDVSPIDLSQIDDADELEAEYARLVTEKGILETNRVSQERLAAADRAANIQVRKGSPALANRAANIDDPSERQESSSEETIVFPLVGIVSNETQQGTVDGESSVKTAQASQVSKETITIIPSSDDGRFAGMRPLDELRKKSMMEVSSGEQEMLSTDDIKMAASSQPNALEEQGSKGGVVGISAGVITENKPGVNPEDKPAVMTANAASREAPPETLHHSYSMGQDQPSESFRNHFSRSRSDDFCSSSGSMDGSHSFTSIEEDDPSSLIECKQYAFVATKKRKIDKATRRRNRSEYGYIESVVAEYFGARRNILCESPSHAKGEYKSTVFTDTSRGCCMAFQ